MVMFFKSAAQWTAFGLAAVVSLPIGIVLGILQVAEDRKARRLRATNG